MKTYFYTLLILIIGLYWPKETSAFQDVKDELPVRGFAIAAPKTQELDRFIRFMQEELAPRGVNVVILRVDFNYQFESHPELRDENALSKSEVKKLVAGAREHDIQLIPQINLLGHQSWASTLGNLLKVYPEFDETPHVALPEKYEWPNADGLYCKSYCPLHPEVHQVVFALMDEIVEVFEADAFHAGMDEVFYIGDDKCPRCQGLDKAELFAGEVTKIRNHLALSDRKLWIWGDRLIDGRATGVGLWEGSYNRTHKAIDLIPKDVVINDWHYEKPVHTPVLFAMKGFEVMSCSWRRPEVGVAHVDDMFLFRKNNPDQVKDKFAGVILTVWSGVTPFLNGFYDYVENPGKEREEKDLNHPWVTFVQMFDRYQSLVFEDN
ncbi:family 20 glycosylhydrolase [Pararhodonellum marinum]|uniref:family 20 glycosylhydrolase n=1 Tax=Pararhodonellum marinum TaxID=2755358 RepID=UPI00188EC011|nr:family 20 glycosylhydrolase [Pararhodonellum marinum]